MIRKLAHTTKNKNTRTGIILVQQRYSSPTMLHDNDAHPPTHLHHQTPTTTTTTTTTPTGVRGGILTHHTAVKRTVTHTTYQHHSNHDTHHTKRAHSNHDTHHTAQEHRTTLQQSKRHRLSNSSASSTNDEHPNARKRTRVQTQKTLRYAPTVPPHTTHTCLSSLHQQPPATQPQQNESNSNSHVTHTTHRSTPDTTGRPHYAYACLNKATSSYEGRHTRHDSTHKMRRNYKNAAGLQQQDLPI